MYLYCICIINSMQLSCWTILLLLLIMSLFNIGLIKLLLLLTFLVIPFHDFKRFMIFSPQTAKALYFCIIIKENTLAGMCKPFIFSVVPLCSHGRLEAWFVPMRTEIISPAASPQAFIAVDIINVPFGQNKVLYRTVRANNRYSWLPQFTTQNYSIHM